MIRKNRYLLTLARVSPRRNNRSRAQTSIFTIENRMSSTRARRQEARKCRPEEFSARMKSFNSHCFFQYFCSPAPVHEGMNNTNTINFPIDFFSISALLHWGTKAEKVRKSFISYFVWYFCFWPRDFGIWTLGSGSLDFGLRTLDLGC